MNSRSTSSLTQIAMAILLVIGVFAGGVAIAIAADDGPAETLTATESEVADATTEGDDADAEPAESADEADDTVEATEAAVVGQADFDAMAESSCYYEPTEEDLAAMRDENDRLAETLDRFGIEYERVTEDDFEYIEYDYENPAIDVVVSSHYNEVYGDDLGFADVDMDEIMELSEALVAAFDNAGLEYDIDEEGLIDWNYENDVANQLAADTLLAIADETGSEFARMAATSITEEEMAEAVAEDFLAEDCIDHPGEPYEPSPEELEEMNRVNDALIAAFDAAGISYELIAEDGFEWVEYDYEDDEANAVAEGVYAELFPFEGDPCFAEDIAVAVDEGDYADEELSDEELAAFEAELAELDIEEYEPTEEELAEMTRVNDALTAAFDAAGIDYETVTDGPFVWIEFDYENPEAIDVADSVYEEMFPNEFTGPIDVCDGDWDIDHEGVEWDDTEEKARSAEHAAAIRAIAADLEAAGVETTFEEGSDDGWEWAMVTFDLDNDAAVPVMTAAVAAHSAG